MSAVQETEPPSGPKFERRKAEIVRAAVHVMNDKGVRGMTLADVARRLDVVPTAVNYYFRRKEDLAAACHAAAIARLNLLLDRSEREVSAAGALRVFLHDFADFLAAVETGGAEPIAALNDVRAIGDAGVDQAFVDLFRRVRRVLRDREPGEAARLRRNARAHLLASQVFWAALWLKGYDPADYRRMVDRLFDILVNGLVAPGAAWNPGAGETSGQAADPEEGPRDAFLRAATEMINAHGYLGASVSRISARLNVTKGSFYHHIPAKDDLVEQCFERTLLLMRQAQLCADASTTTGLDNVASLASGLVRRDISGAAVLLRTSALTALPEEVRSRMVRRFDRASARMASVVSDGVADGSIRPVDAHVAAQALTAMINASAELVRWAPQVTAETVVEVYVRPLFTGLLNTSPA